MTVQLASAASERTLSFHNLHTGETVTAVYKRDGRYVQSGLDQLNHILRDWRRDEATEMDPRLYDLAWEIYQQSGSQQPINIISGYRSPTTNEMLRSNSNGVAQNSQHLLGKAMDIQFPDVSLETMRNVALRMQIGGVGYYPTSGSPFVHIDTGSVRHWPRLSRSQLAAVFPDGQSLHIPSDGTPLPGYDDAQRAFQERGDQVVALFGAPSDNAGPERRLAALFDRNDNQPEPAPVAEPPALAVAGVTVLPEPPPARAEIPGISVTEPVGAALAFAPATDPEPDPLAMLTTPTPRPTPAPAVALANPEPEPRVAAAPIERRWFDPLAELSAPIVNSDTMTAIAQPGTLRQAGAVRLSTPYVGASPEFLMKPERVVAGGFEPGRIIPNTTAFAGYLSTVAMVDLVRFTVAANP